MQYQLNYQVILESNLAKRRSACPSIHRELDATNTAAGLGNVVAITLGNDKFDTGAGFLNAATVTGAPGSTVEVDDPTLGTTLTTITDAVGNKSFNTAFGAANGALTTLGNGNINTAAGAGNAAAVTGTPGVTVSAVETVLGVVTASDLTTTSATGQNNINTAGGFLNAATTLGSNNLNNAFGISNAVTTLGTPGVTEVLTLPVAGTTTSITSPTGVGNSTNVFGLGNTGTTLTGNNKNKPFGFNNAVGSLGTPGELITNTLTGISLNMPATGNNNQNTAFGGNNSAVSILANAQKNIAVGFNQHKP